MAIGEDVKLVEYSKKIDLGNCLTHSVGAVFGIAALIMLTVKSLEASSARITAAAVIYGLSIIAVYTVSAVYHGLPRGEKKRKARLVDHSTIALLIAGTATPCAMVSLYKFSAPHCVFVMCCAWFCFLFGLFSKLFFFEKLKTAVMVVDIAGGAAMLISAVPLLGEINHTAFALLVSGCAVYLLGGLFCNLGIKRPALHIPFHILVLAGSVIHFAAIYSFVF